MNLQRILAILLIAAGVMGLAYGGFTYNKTTHEAQIGTLEISVRRSNPSTCRYGPESQRSARALRCCCSARASAEPPISATRDPAPYRIGTRYRRDCGA